jgi:hypothetical protein
MIALGITIDDGTAEPAIGTLAWRCRCDRPVLIATEEGPRCLKCGRSPAIRLGAVGADTIQRPADQGGTTL